MNFLEHYLPAHKNKQRPLKMSVSQGKLRGGNKSVLLKKRPREGATISAYSATTSGESSYHC